MNRAEALLPSLPLWLAVSLALAAEGALLAGLAAWPAPRDPEFPSTPIEVSLVSVPVLADSAAAGAAGGLSSAATPEPRPEPEPIAPAPPVASPEPTTTPVALAPPKPKPAAKPRVKPKPKPKQALKPKPAPSRPASPPKPSRSLAKADQGFRSHVKPASGEKGEGGKGTGQTSDKNRTAGKGASSNGPSSPAAYLNNPSPGYPDAARRLRQEGTVHLRVLVNASGRAGEVAIANSSGVASLDQAALRAVRRWRFKPARQNGQAITAWVRVPIRFTLNQ
ncbi:TonB family protein [Thiocystis violacea]|uniref:TonB family protein n=1 Tax=Thiocystis violacea TaxID=13725 RepID=UPI0019034DBA|nr:hypothetical protein [Thiocystis violacea]